MLTRTIVNLNYAIIFIIKKKSIEIVMLFQRTHSVQLFNFPNENFCIFVYLKLIAIFHTWSFENDNGNNQFFSYLIPKPPLKLSLINIKNCRH